MATLTERHPARRYSGVAMALHWIIAALLVFELALGLRADFLPRDMRGALFALHKPVGITILLLTLVRIGWRATHRPPPLPRDLQPWERVLATGTHHLFYLLLVLIPLGGWVIVSTGGKPGGVDMFGLFKLPPIPGLAGQGALHEVAETGHWAAAWAAIVLILLHVAGALKHQFVDRKPHAERMVPAPRAALGTALLAFLAFVAAAFAFGWVSPLPDPPPVAIAR